MTKDNKSSATRRKFLSGAAVAGVATIAAPTVAKAQGPISMRWQSTWPSKDIFHEYALDYAKKVNDMTGGDLKIEVLPAGAVVPAFGLLDAVSKGTLDGGHGVLVYHYGKQSALALWGSGPGYAHGCQHAARLAQIRRRQGVAGEAIQLDRRQRRLVPVRTDADPAARLVQEADHQAGRLQGPQVPHRRHLGRRVHRRWAPR